MKDQLRQVIETVESLDMIQILEDTHDLILPYVEADPRKEAGMDYTVWYQNVLREWIQLRAGEMESFWRL